MATFQVNFAASPASVKAVGDMRAVEESVAVREAEKKLQQQIAQSMEAIAGNLETLNLEIREQREMIRSTTLALASEMVRHLLGTERDLVRRRLERNLKLALQFNESPAVTVAVHPDCVAIVKGLLEKQISISQPFISGEVSERIEFAPDSQIVPDASLTPGDCRLDFDETGVLAGLDWQVELLRDKLSVQRKGAAND